MITGNKKKKRTLLFIVSITVTVLIVSCGVIYFIYSKNSTIKREYETVESIGEWKLSQIVNWRNERIREFNLLLSENFISQAKNYITNDDQDSKTYIEQRFNDTLEGNQIHCCILLDEDFNMIMRTNEASLSDKSSSETIAALLKSKEIGEPVVSDFYICKEGDVHLDIVGSLRDTDGSIFAYLVLKINVEVYLYPLVQQWPLTSDTAESLLFEVDGTDILFLNELRHLEDNALTFRIPLTQTDLPAVQAAEGARGIIIGPDYRGVKVIAYGNSVPDTNWYIISKIDYSEAFQSLKMQLLYIALIIALLLVISPIIILYFVKRSDYSNSLRLYEAEKEKNETNAFFKFVINNLPQRIFWKDKNLNFMGCNIHFAKDMGFASEDEVIGLTSYDIFPQETADRFTQVEKKIIETLKPQIGYVEKGTLNNKDKWLYKSKVPVFDESQNLIGILSTFEDVTRQKEIGDELDRHAKFLHAIYENINAILFSYDSVGVVTFMEGKVLGKLGISREETIGLNFSDTFKNPEVISGYIESLQGKTASVSEVPFNDIYLNFFFQPTLDSNGKTTSVYGVAVDETQLHKAISNLKRSNTELEQFAYVASHDLQEPLRMVSNFTQLLEKKYYDKLDDQAKKYIFYAVDGAKRMQILINDLLNYSRINTREKEHISVDMNTVLSHVKAGLSEQIRETGAIIDSQKLPVITAEPTQMYQMIQNLISNSIKFTTKGTVPRISISFTESQSQWQFCIADNGIGIEEKYKDRIFQIFQRLYSRSEYSGTGIGLAVCQRIAIKHGGKIWFKSTPGSGTSFYFTISKSKKEHNNG